MKLTPKREALARHAFYDLARHYEREAEGAKTEEYRKLNQDKADELWAMIEELG